MENLRFKNSAVTSFHSKKYVPCGKVTDCFGDIKKELFNCIIVGNELHYLITFLNSILPKILWFIISHFNTQLFSYFSAVLE